MNRIALFPLAAAGLIATLATAGAMAPPLILEPDRYSYTFAVPQGWDFSFAQAQEFGVRLVYFAQDSSFHDSESVIYVNESCHENCAGRVNEVIRDVILKAKAASPNLTVEEAESLPLKSGGRIPVRILTGAADPRQAKEALAFIEHSDVTVLVVLTTKNPATWTKDYRAFAAVLAGHELFDCAMPGLKVPCSKGRELTAETFQAAHDLAKRDMTTPEGEAYEKQQFTPYFGERHAKTLQTCFKEIPDPDSSPFTFVVVLDGSGHPLAVTLSAETNVGACLRTALIKDRFPGPPFRGFHESVDMKFAK